MGKYIIFSGLDKHHVMDNTDRRDNVMIIRHAADSRIVNSAAGGIVSEVPEDEPILIPDPEEVPEEIPSPDQEPEEEPVAPEAESP
jgi:hypothetical protein